MAYQGGKKSSARRAERGSINRAAKLELVEQRKAHGILVYDGDEPVGWCQFGPATELPVGNERGADDVEPVWRITCFVTHKQYRRQGVAEVALQAALRAIARNGGGRVEGYPFPYAEPPNGGKPIVVDDIVDGIGTVSALCRWWAPAFHTGTVEMFERAGFSAVGIVPRAGKGRQLARTGADDLARVNPTRVVMAKTM